jgi:predicted RNA-binding protein YlxR (DUF448 family)
MPVRMCVVCREKGDKRSLTRIVRAETGVRVDLTGKMNGRGAYLCDRDSCWERALAGGVLNGALRTTLTEEDRKQLLQAKPTMAKP